MSQNLSVEAEPIVKAFLDTVDDELSGLVVAFYLVGSIALSDFRPHRSDVDFVAVLERHLDTSELDTLAHIHMRLQERWPKPFFDGIYVTWADLASDPSRLEQCPSAHEGQLQPTGSGDIIAWHTLVQCGIPCRGPSITPGMVWTNSAALAAWTNANLDAYWQRLVDRTAPLLTRRGMISLSAWYCEWCVTGVSRLHYTLATGAITSKEGAAVYARTAFPARWQRVVDEALRIRRDAGARSLYRSSLARRADVRAYTQMLIDDAHRLYKDKYST